MDRKNLYVVVLAVSILCTLMAPLAVSGSPGIPNPDHIYYASIGNIESVDPHWAYDTASFEFLQHIYEPLCAFEGNHTDRYVAKLADWWPGYGENPGNTITPSPPHPDAPDYVVETWYFRIRTGVKWHDSKYGTVTPEDVEYSFERGMLQDHSWGPMWMLYEPLTGRDTSYEWDTDEDGNLSKTEYIALATMIDKAIESNETHVWFNLYQPYAPFQQILSQGWSFIMCRQWCEEHGLWNKTLVETYGWDSDEAYKEFLRCWDPPEPGPLMEQPDAPGPVVPGPVAMGTGPYKLVAINPDPHTGFWTVEKFDDYWGGWPAKYATRATMKVVEEWATRKAMFFSVDPGLQVDLTDVPRANCPELHEGGDKDAPTLKGFMLHKLVSPVLAAAFFCFDVDEASPYVPLVGGEPRTDIFKDRYLRLAFIYCVNFTKLIQDALLGEGGHPGVCMPPGTAFYNESKPVYDINLTKAQWYFEHALGGEIYNNGLVMTLAYNLGNEARRVSCEIMEYYIENYIEWPEGVVVEINVEGQPWPTFLDNIRHSRLPVFFVGWLADYPDPHNWFQPFMDPYGTYCQRQKVEYGLDPDTLAENWYEGAKYGPPPYTNVLGEYVPEINNTYVHHMISEGIKYSPDIRQEIYEELMDIYYAEATQLPLYYTIGRRYFRDWLHGIGEGNWNDNPISPGWHFYYMYKEARAPLETADISAVDTIVNATLVYKTLQVYHGEMRCNGEPASITFDISCKYLEGSGTTTVIAYLGFFRNDTTVPEWTVTDMAFPFNVTFTVGPGESYSRTYIWYENGTMWAGNWTLGIYASPTAGVGGETIEDPNTANNKHTSIYVVRALELDGDINGDGVVNILDAIALAKAFGYSEGETNFNPDADLKPDGTVNILDAIALAKAFGNRLVCEFW